MRDIDAALRARFESPQQTAAANADPRAVVWISRPTVPLTDAEFLDAETVLSAQGLTACSVAVRRPQADREADRVYLAFIDENGAHVVFSPTRPKLSDFVWTDAGFAAADAEDVAIAFDGTMPKKTDGSAQFVTESFPWVFWISSGVLKARKLGLLGETTLAASNAGAVSAVRATWAEASNLDFGLVVFFTLSGALYYRQLIGGEWRDAEAVTFGPPGVTWTALRAFRTWDYRVGVQALGSDGKVYELFTQFQGIGKHGAEHIGLSADAAGALIPITEQLAALREHISLSVASGAPYGGLYRTGTPQLTGAENLDDGGDWGKRATFHYDRHLNAAEVAAQNTAFRIVDANGQVFVAQTAAVSSDGFSVELTFLNFNGAAGVCKAAYVPGTVHTMAGAALIAAEKSFTPTSLVPPGVPAPAVASVANSGDAQIVVTFDRALTGSLTGAASHFAALLSVPVYSPGGELLTERRTPSSVTASGDSAVVLTFPAGNLTDLTKAWGNITLEYDGAGPLTGAGGPVQPFAVAFAPVGLTPKPDPGDPEHVSLGVTASGTLTRVYTTNTRNYEHIELTVTATGTLTHVNDL